MKVVVNNTKKSSNLFGDITNAVRNKNGVYVNSKKKTMKLVSTSGVETTYSFKTRKGFNVAVGSQAAAAHAADREFSNAVKGAGVNVIGAFAASIASSLGGAAVGAVANAALSLKAKANEKKAAKSSDSNEENK